MLSVYNTLTAKKEPFTPFQERQVNMYTCGVTVYDKCHLGHGRSLYIFEVMRRYLVYKGYRVKIIRNITDVDDKIIAKARQLQEKNTSLTITQAVEEVTRTNIASYYEDLKRLGLPKADGEPKATEHIKDMISFIEALIKKNTAYHKDGNVYFRIKSFADYGRLSKRDTEQMIAGSRVDIAEEKDDPLDFALWKKAKENEPSWPSPWGNGRPGWHIECSAMSRKYLGDTLDIHGGGKDLIFPHHENERAQSESLTGKPFSRYWLHHGLITVNKQKMAKSLGNFITLEDILSRYSSDTVKIFYLAATYHSPLDYSDEAIQEAEKVRKRLMIIEERLAPYTAADISTVHEPALKKVIDAFTKALDDDFNMPLAFSTVFDIVELVTGYVMQGERMAKQLAEARSIFELMKKIFVLDMKQNVEAHPAPVGMRSDVLLPDISTVSDEEIEDFIEKRKELRKQKKFKEADGVRDELLHKGIILEDFPDGRTLWRRR